MVTLQHGLFVAYMDTDLGHVSKQPLWVARVCEAAQRGRMVLKLVRDAQHANATLINGTASFRQGNVCWDENQRTSRGTLLELYAGMDTQQQVGARVLLAMSLQCGIFMHGY